jgi:hypothetical protein
MWTLINESHKGADMDNADILAAVLDAGTRILAARILAFVALLMVFGLFCWAIYLGTWVAFAIAATFGLTIFLPVLWQAKRAQE